MQCIVCKYKDNCKSRIYEPLLSGCTSGHPTEFINLPEKWVLCPVCGEKINIKIRPDTEVKNLIVFCSKCKKKTVVDINDMESKVVEE